MFGISPPLPPSPSARLQIPASGFLMCALGPYGCTMGYLPSPFCYYCCYFLKEDPGTGGQKMPPLKHKLIIVRHGRYKRSSLNKEVCSVNENTQKKPVKPSPPSLRSRMSEVWRHFYQLRNPGFDWLQYCPYLWHISCHHPIICTIIHPPKKKTSVVCFSARRC